MIGQWRLQFTKLLLYTLKRATTQLVKHTTSRINSASLASTLAQFRPLCEEKTAVCGEAGTVRMNELTILPFGLVAANLTAILGRKGC